MNRDGIERPGTAFLILSPGDKVRNIATGLCGTVTLASHRHGIHVDTGWGPKVWDAAWVEPVSTP